MVVPWKSLLGWLSVSISPKTERDDATVKQFYRLSAKMGSSLFNQSSEYYFKLLPERYSSICFNVEELYFHVTSPKKSAILKKKKKPSHLLYIAVMFFNRRVEH